MDDFIYMSAPIEGLSDNIFRSICCKYGADLTFTEMVRLDGLVRRNKSTLQRIELIDDTPVVIQLLGSNESHLKRFLNSFKAAKGFNGFNINLGCPSPHIVNIGQGCAMIKRISKITKLVNIIKKEGYKVSIKMRLGLNRHERLNKVYLNLIENVDVDFFVVHARYGSQKYDEPADNSVYQECVDTGKKIIANGDIKTRDQINFFKSIGVKGVMIGRAAALNPSIFDFLKGKRQNLVDTEIIKKEYIALADKADSLSRYGENFLKHIGQKDNVNRF